MKKTLHSLLTIVLIFYFGIAAAVSTPLDSIYHALKSSLPAYDNIAYAQPSVNTLDNDGTWIIQTPNAWGTSLSRYNSAISTAAAKESIDPVFYLPTCHHSTDCSGGRQCVQPDFSHPAFPKLQLCLGPESMFQTKAYRAIVSAQRTVDITTLQPSSISQSAFSTGAFTPTLKNALIELAVKANNNKQPITVRLLQGGVLPITTQAKNHAALKSQSFLNPEKTFLKDIVNSPLFPTHTPYFNLYVATERSCYLLTGKCDGNSDQDSAVFRVSWNHGKIIDIDHTHIITGGQNLWGSDYLQTNPVNDLNMAITGPVTQGADTYINTMWNYVIHHQHSQINSNICASFHNGMLTDDCPMASSRHAAPPNAWVSNNRYPVEAMFVSKLNNGILPRDADASELARVVAFKNARSSIKISQQAIYFKLAPIGTPALHPIPTVEGNIIDALATAISHNVTVDIVTSNLNGLGFSYTSEVSSSFLEQAITTSLEKNVPAFHDPTQAKAQIKKYLTIKTIRYNKNDPDGKKTLSHDKLWIVDDKLFYIGSHNLYPSALQQFGVIIEDDHLLAINQLENRLWNPLWENSATFTPN